MAATIPLTEPASVTAGDRWQWDREDLSDYPASSWTLSYALTKVDKLITLTATANGDYHRIDVTAVVTADYPAGKYHWQAYVTNGSDRRSIGAGTLEIKPNLALQTQGYDARSFAEQRVDQLEKALMARDPAIAAYTVAGRTVQYHSMQDIREDLDYWRSRLVQEKASVTGAKRLMVRL